MDCSPPGSPVLGISQARILEWVAISFSRESSWPRDGTCISCLASGFFTIEPAMKPLQGSWLHGGSDCKDCLQCGRLRFDLWVSRLPWRREWPPTPCSCLGDPMDRGAWWNTHYMVSQRVGHNWKTNSQQKENKDQRKVIGQKCYDSGQNIHAIVIEMIVYIFSQVSDMLISYLKLFKMQSCLRF